MPELLASVGRLSTLARVGRVVLDRRRLAQAGPDMPDGVAAFGQMLAEHGLDAIELASTITDAEFLKLAGLLSGSPEAAATMKRSADALSMWNVRCRWTHDPDAAAPRAALAPTAGFAAPLSAATAAAAPAAEPWRPLLDAAVAQGDGAALCGLLAGLASPAEFARAATAGALDLVVEQLLDTRTPREDVLAVLQRAGAAGARALFAQLIAAIDVAERRQLYDAMVGLPATAEVAREYLSHDVWYVVRNAVCQLGETRAQAAIPLVSQALRHADYRVRIAAVVALGQIGGAAAIARLESVLFDASEDVRTRALAIVFAGADAPPAPDRLGRALTDDQAIEYQREMVAALGHLSTPRARERLQRVCETPSSSYEGTELRLAALDALRRRHPAVADVVLQALRNDPSPMMRERVAALLR
jgi:HEAT repeat protein